MNSTTTTRRSLPAAPTQAEVAEEFAARNADVLRYAYEKRTWYHFTTEQGWRANPSFSAVQRRLLTLVRDLQSEPSATQAEQRKRARVMRGMEKPSTVNAIADFAKRCAPIEAELADFVEPGHLLGVKNGILDLRQGVLLPFTPDKLITRRVPWAYDQDATCPRWQAFLREVLGDDPDVQDYVQRVIGYVLTGDTSLQQMWLCIGAGANGKSTFIGALRTLLGPDYAQQAPETVLLGKPSQGSATSELARLEGARLVALTETDEGQHLNETRVKALVSGDPIAARELYQSIHEFEPTAKFFLATNHLPVVRGTDEGIWRRLVVIPFERTFGVNLDPRLADELKAEMPGILAWALHGAQQWFATHAIPVPDAFTAPTRTYRMDQDPVRAFLNDCTDQLPDAKVEATALHQAYTRWCDEQGRAALAQGEFGRRMTMLHGPSAKGGKAKRARYDGLRLKADDAAQEVIPLPGIGDAEEQVA
jgi:P4 family phage/plasmid primase-like protien